MWFGWMNYERSRSERTREGHDSVGRKREPTCKPGSVESSHSSATHVAVRL